VPGIHTNLFSVGKFTDLGYRIIFNNRKCYILDKEQPSNIYLQAVRDCRNKLYKIENGPHQLSLAVLPSEPDSSIAPTPIPEVHQSPPHDQPAPVSISSAKRSSNVHLWHRRIGHINYQLLYHMTSRGLVTGTPTLLVIKHVCKSCAMGKMHKDRVPKVRTTSTTRPLQLIHSDLCRPLPTTSKTGNRYILTFIDDYTRKTWLYFLAMKSQTLALFKQFKTLVETPLHRIQTLRSDRGGEYLSAEFSSYCSTQGIHRQLTAAYSPYQNGLAERKNRTVLEGIRSVVAGTKIPRYLWEEIAKAVNYIQNRCPTKAIKLKTPEEMYTGIRPNISHFRVLGCVAYCHIPDAKRTRL
jgi:hypothetical protein